MKKINWLKIAGIVMLSLGIIGLVGGIFSSPMMLAGSLSGMISEVGGPSTFGILLWEAAAMALAIGNIIIGQRLKNVQNEKNFNSALSFQLVYLFGFNIVLALAFGMEFVKAFGFVGASFFPIICLAFLLIGKGQLKK